MSITLVVLGMYFWLACAAVAYFVVRGWYYTNEWTRKRKWSLIVASVPLGPIALLISVISWLRHAMKDDTPAKW